MNPTQRAIKLRVGWRTAVWWGTAVRGYSWVKATKLWGWSCKVNCVRWGARLFCGWGAGLPSIDSPVAALRRCVAAPVVEMVTDVGASRKDSTAKELLS
jgi:hypothetical protein